MPPLPADSIHARACKLKCEKILTRPLCVGAHIQSSTRNACPWTSGVEALDSLTFVTIHVRFCDEKVPSN